MDAIEWIAEQRIRQAMQDGRFDHLPGAGQPLNLDDEPLVDPAWRMAGHLLRVHGFSLPWIELRREIDAECQAAREALASDWAGASVSAGEAALQRRAFERFKAEIEKLNGRILSYNLQTPLPRFHLRPLDPEREAARILGALSG